MVKTGLKGPEINEERGERGERKEGKRRRKRREFINITVTSSSGQDGFLPNPPFRGGGNPS